MKLLRITLAVLALLYATEASPQILGNGPSGSVVANSGASSAPAAWTTPTLWLDRWCSSSNARFLIRNTTWGCAALTGDATMAATGALTFATVNANVGTFGSATACDTITVNAKGLITAISAATCTPAFGSLTGTIAIGQIANSLITLAKIENMAANTVLSNWTAGATAPTANVWPACAADGVHALTYTNGTGVLCTSISGTLTSVTCGGLAITSSGVCPPPFEFQNCTLAASVGSNLLTVALKDNAGSNNSATSPCYIGFRDPTATTGSTVYRSVTAALSISTNATGASLGTLNSTAFRIWVVAFDNAGTVVLGLYQAVNQTASPPTALNCTSIDEAVVQSSTAISGSATSAATYYTPNGTTVSAKAVKVIGYVEYNATGLATAGTYATAPNFIQTMGPAIKRPCEPIQHRMVSSTTGNSTSSTTAVVALTDNITPKSAANLIRLNTTGKLATTTLLNPGFLSIKNNTTLLAKTQVVNLSTVSLNFAGGLGAWDKPNSASSVTYNVTVEGDGVHTFGFGNNGDGTTSCSFEIQEYQG